MSWRHFSPLLKQQNRKMKEFFFEKMQQERNFFWPARAYTSNADEIQDANVDS
jgi:hypothetical protein